MNLADMLTYADIGQLTVIAGRYQCQCKQNSKHDLIQSILVTLGSRPFLESRIREYRPEELRFLNTLLFDGRSYFSLEDLLAAAKQACFDTEEGTVTPRDLVARFKNGGWLYNGVSQQTRYLYQLPKDLQERFRELMGEQIRERITISPEPDMYRSEGTMLESDVLLLLRYIRDHEPELNQEGAMHKRHQQGLMNSLHLPEPLLGKGGWRFGYGRAGEHYPPRLALMYDYARHRRWITEEGFCLRLTAAGTAVLENRRCDQLMQIYSFWLRLYKGAIPNLPSLVYWIGTCSDQWVTVESLVRAVGWMVKPFYYDDASSMMEGRILRMMVHLGMLRLGDTPEGPAAMLTAWGAGAIELKK